MEVRPRRIPTHSVDTTAGANEAETVELEIMHRKVRLRRKDVRDIVKKLVKNAYERGTTNDAAAFETTMTEELFKALENVAKKRRK